MMTIQKVIRNPSKLGRSSSRNTLKIINHPTISSNKRKIVNQNTLLEDKRTLLPENKKKSP